MLKSKKLDMLDVWNESLAGAEEKVYNYRKTYRPVKEILESEKIK